MLKELNMPDPSNPSKQINYRYVDIKYEYSPGKREDLLIRTPILECKRGLTKEEKKQEQTLTYQQPMMQGYHPTMMYQQQIQPQKKSNMQEYTCALYLNISEKQEHAAFFQVLKAIKVHIDKLLYPLRGSVYAGGGSLKEGDSIVQKNIFRHPQDPTTKIEDETRDPTLWTKLRKDEKGLKSTFFVPGGEGKYIDYKDLIGNCFEGIFLVSPRIFAGALTRTFQTRLQACVVTDFKLSELAEEVNNIANEIASLDLNIGTRVQEGLAKAKQMRESNKEVSDSTEDAAAKEEQSMPVADLPQTCVPQTAVPQTYQQPMQTPNPMLTPGLLQTGAMNANVYPGSNLYNILGSRK